MYITPQQIKNVLAAIKDNKRIADDSRAGDECKPTLSSEWYYGKMHGLKEALSLLDIMDGVALIQDLYGLRR